jgi:DNA-binding winged helix-turn-helix (wHTH) protein
MAKQIKVGPLKIAGDNVTFHGQPVILTDQQTALLRALAANAGEVIERGDLLVAIRVRDDISGRKLVDTKICQVRKALQKASPDGAHGIETIHGVGYRMNAKAQAKAAPVELSAIPQGETFHHALFAALDNATFNGAALPKELHYALWNGLRFAQMRGLPMRNWSDVEAAVSGWRRSKANAA